MVLAAGSGKRMRSGMAKQFMTLGGRPLLWYSLQAVERSAIIHDCVLVTGEKDIPYVRAEILERYGFRKAAAVIAGGGERYGLQCLKGDCGGMPPGAKPRRVRIHP